MPRSSDNLCDTDNHVCLAGAALQRLFASAAQPFAVPLRALHPVPGAIELRARVFGLFVLVHISLRSVCSIEKDAAFREAFFVL